MTKKSTVEEVKERISKMLAEREEELTQIRNKKEEALAAKQAADVKLKEATRVTDLDAYEEAKAEKRRAQAAIDMYNERYAQISRQEYISESDSDAVIGSLLAYEDDLQRKFLEDIAEPLARLAQINETYIAAIADTEATIRTWTGSIHDNYNSWGRSTYTDPETGERTNRAPVPIPVRNVSFIGCIESQDLKEYLKKYQRTQG